MGVSQAAQIVACAYGEKFGSTESKSLNKEVTK